MKRKIITIDEEKCDGCALCIPNCPEGAIRIIDGKAKLVSDALCDGLGACLGNCPRGAITIEERETEAYDERRVIENVIAQGDDALKAHIRHLMEHRETENLQVAFSVLKAQGKIPSAGRSMTHEGGGCPGSRSMNFAKPPATAAGGTGPGQETAAGKRPSQLTHWPIQLHLISPRAPQYHKKDLLLAADCVPFTLADFHRDYLQGRALAIACPKLDDGQEIYLEKLIALIETAEVNTITVMTMEVPCCGGLLRLAQEAAGKAARKIPVKHVMVSLQGEILSESWV